MSTHDADVIAVRKGDDLDWVRLESWLVSNVANLDGSMTRPSVGRVVLKQLHGRQDMDSRSETFGASADEVLVAATALATKYAQ